MKPLLVEWAGELEGKAAFCKFNCNKENKDLGKTVRRGVGGRERGREGKDREEWGGEGIGSGRRPGGRASRQAA